MVQVNVKRVGEQGRGPRRDEWFKHGRSRRVQAGCGNGCMGAVLKWFAIAGMLVLLADQLQAVQVTSYARALVVAVVIGLLNAIVRPILVVLTLPITLLTLGLFVLVINAVLLMATSWLIEGFDIDGFGWALLVAVILAATNVVLDAVLKRK